MHDHVELLYAFCHKAQLRAHGGVAEYQRDGAWHKYKGLVDEGLLEYVKRSFTTLEGLFILFGEKRCNFAGDRDLLAAMDQYFSVDMRTQSTSIALSKLQEKATYAASIQLDDPNEHKYRKAGAVIGKIGSALQKDLLHKSIFEYFGAWCSTRKIVQAGACFNDVCFIEVRAS